MYLVLSAADDDDGNMVGFTYKKDHRARSFQQGQRFSDDPETKEWNRPPKVPIRLDVKKGREKLQLPSFLAEPAPLMSKALVELLRKLGAKNIDVYEAELYDFNGKLLSEDYYLVNVVDVASPKEAKEKGLLIFRIVDDEVELAVHQRVREAVEAANLPLVRFFDREYLRAV